MSAREAKAAQLLEALKSRGGRVSAEDGRLRVAAPDGVISGDVAAAIRDLKPELLAMLSEKIPVADRSRPLPLGVVQERMWAHAQMEPDALIYNLPAAWRFRGSFDAARFAAAFAAFVARHEALRTRIQTIDGAPRQTFSAEPAILAVEDLSRIADADQRDAALAADMEALRLARFDLELAPPYVARLYRLGAAEHALFFMPHHLVWDGWCFDIFMRDLVEIYEAASEDRAPTLPRLSIQYTDYALWHRRETERGRYAADLEFWEKTLSPVPSPPNLPADRPRPALFSQDGDWIDVTIEREAIARVKALATEHRATTFMTFLAVWRAFLARISGDCDIVVGAPVQARQHADIGDVIGCFVNTIFLRQTIDLSRSLAQAVAATREICVAAYAHQEAPVALLVDRLVRQRDPARTPLCEAMFSHQQTSRRPLRLGLASIEQIHVNPRSSPTDLMLAVMERDDSARLVLHYATALYSPELARSLINAFRVFFEAAIENPRDPLRGLPLLDAEARKRILVDLNATSADFDRTLRAHHLIAQAAARRSGKPAVICRGETVSYSALEARAAALAGWLSEQGVGRGDIVGLMLPRSPDMIASALALWSLGAAYLPLDPSFPEQRLAYMAEDSGAKLLLSTSAVPGFGGRIAALRRNLDEADVNSPAATGDRNPSGPRRGPPSSQAWEKMEAPTGEPAYVIYTSGSTGKPKGVQVGHKALANFIHAMIKRPGVDADDRVLALTTLSFDISVLELLVPLAAGATVVLASAEEAAEGGEIARLIRERGVTLMQATPAGWRLLLDSGWAGAPGLKALCGGEALSRELARDLLGKVGALWNMYGPTETTVWSACKRIADPGAITIGRPIDNTALYVVDACGEPVPESIPGELWIGGEGAAIGYLNRPELTAERFVADPFRPGGRAYRTGDLARLGSDGEVEILGRIDAQVKLRGFRIELGEIEAALETHKAVAKAVAALKPDPSGELSLAAYIQYKDGAAATGSELRKALRRTLPNYMLPQHFVEIRSFPLTGSGKVDRKALPAPDGAPAARAARTAPRSDLERAIADIWKGVLSVDDISVTDNFFELGGQSLQAAQMAARVRERTGVAISPRAVIFETLEQLAASAR
jgi:amino acid adenylation domain-containing protein